MFTIKVGSMPGKLQEVIVSEGTTAREIFGLAEVTVSNHEVRLDGEVIDIDDALEGGKLLVAMSKIKGNAKTIKVGNMPGKLSELQFTGNETARELFELAGITISNHEIRLDGTVIDIDNIIADGKLLVSMTKIKGNKECIASNVQYVSSLNEEEILILLGDALPTFIQKNEVVVENDYVIVNGDNIFDKDMFFSVYQEIEIIEEEKEGEWFAGMSLKVEPSMYTGISIAPEEEHVCTCKNAVDVVKAKIESVKSDLSYYEEVIGKKRAELYVLQDVLMEIK